MLRVFLIAFAWFALSFLWTSFARAEEIPTFGSKEYIKKFISAKTPFAVACGCARLDCIDYNRTYSLIWKGNDPETLTCIGCDTKYPNPEFPEDTILTLGDEEHRCYKDSRGKLHFFSGCVSYHKTLSALSKATAVSAQYAKSGDRSEPEGVRNVLLAFAEYYPKYFYARSPTGSPGMPTFPEVPGELGAGRLKQFFGDYGIASMICSAYRNIEKSGVVSESDRVKIRSLVEDVIQQSLFPYFKHYRAVHNTMSQAMCDLILAGKTFPDMTVKDLVYEYHFKQPRVLRGPDLVHEAIEGEYGVKNLLENGFYTDGFWFEGSLSYDLMVLNALLPTLREVQGYSDPLDYKPLQEDWRRLDNYQQAENAFLRRVMNCLRDLALPDGGVLPLADSHKLNNIYSWREKIPKFLDCPDATQPQNKSCFQDGIGVAALRCGEGIDSAAAFLIYGKRGDGHSHYDQLSLTFYDLGHELATDIGYPGSTDALRRIWWQRTGAHNTVVVDGKNQIQSMGKIAIFAETPGFQILQASCDNAFPDVDDYRRAYVLVGDPTDETRPRYLVDFFHVVGGKMHDYAFHAQSDPSSPEETFVTDCLPLSIEEEPQKKLAAFTPGCENENVGYDTITHIRRGTTPAKWSADWRMPYDPILTLRLHRLPDATEEVFIGSASAHRLDPRFGSVDSRKKMTWLCSRTVGDLPLRTSFVSVIEAFRGDASAISSVRRLSVTAPPDAMAAAVEIKHASGTDLIVASRRSCEMTIPEYKDLRVDARIASISFDTAGNLKRTSFVDGKGLSVAGRQICPETLTLTGKIVSFPEGISEKDLVTEVDRDVPACCVGKTLTLEHANKTGSAWKIISVERSSTGKAIINLDRSAREGTGVVKRFDADGKSLFCNTGFRPLNKELGPRYFNRLWVVLDGKWHKMESLSLHDLKEPFLYEAKLTDALPESARLEGQRFISTRVAVGDEFTIANVASETW